MGIEYYAYALFVTAMVCIVAIVFKMLFADVRRQRKLLEEKETELYDFYRTVRNVMEEFFDQVETVQKDIRDHEDKLIKLKLQSQPQPQPPIIPSLNKALEHAKLESLSKLPRREIEDTGVDRIRIASEVIGRAEKVIKGDISAADETKPAFEQYLEDSVTAEAEAAKDPVAAAKQKRNKTILELNKQGKTTAQIAEELSITQNEVKLIIELEKRD